MTTKQKEDLDLLEKEQAANPLRHIVHWVKDGKADKRVYSGGQAAQEFAMLLYQQGTRGIQIKSEKLPR